MEKIREEKRLGAGRFKDRRQKCEIKRSNYTSSIVYIECVFGKGIDKRTTYGSGSFQLLSFTNDLFLISCAHIFQIKKK
jgi:hypothetical protein